MKLDINDPYQMIKFNLSFLKKVKPFVLVNTVIYQSAQELNKVDGALSDLINDKTIFSHESYLYIEKDDIKYNGPNLDNEKDLKTIYEYLQNYFNKKNSKIVLEKLVWAKEDSLNFSPLEKGDKFYIKLKDGKKVRFIN